MVMSNSLSLRFACGTLNLVPNENDWARVNLCRAGSDETIGAEKSSYLAERLGLFLEHPSDTLQWVLTLSETHNTLYGEVTNDCIHLRIQNQQAMFFADIVISQQDRCEWLSQLADWKSP